jgi:hypothetical protein
MAPSHWIAPLRSRRMYLNPLSASYTLKTAAKICAEKLEQFQQMMWLNPLHSVELK